MRSSLAIAELLGISRNTAKLEIEGLVEQRSFALMKPTPILGPESRFGDWPLRLMDEAKHDEQDETQIDAAHRRIVHGAAVPGLAPDCGMLRGDGLRINRERVQRLNGDRRTLSQAADQPAAAPGHKIYSLSAARLSLGRAVRSADFACALEKAGVAISLDGRGGWMDNLLIERPWGRFAGSFSRSSAGYSRRPSGQLLTFPPACAAGFIPR